MRCILCGKDITCDEAYMLFNFDGDFAHVNCNKNKDSYFTAINNLTDDEFEEYLINERELNE